MKNLLRLLVVLPLLVFPGLCPAENLNEKDVVCATNETNPLMTPFAFAKATMTSLWYARNAALQGNRVQEETKSANNYLSLMTGLMRVTKLSTNQFVCAKRSIAPFTTKKSGENISLAAQFLTMIYDQHIDLNNRGIEVIKSMASAKDIDLADKLSTLQVERGERWADLAQPTTLALMLLVDTEHPDANNKVTRLIITRAERDELVGWTQSHFSEFKDEPEEKWSDPAKTAHLLFTLVDGRKCADEVSK